MFAVKNEKNTMKLIRLTLLFAILSTSVTLSWAQSAPEHSINSSNFERRNNVQIFPNPTVDFLFVQIENSDLSNPTIEVYNIIGNLTEVSLEKTDHNKYRIDVKSLPAGYYLVTIKDDNGTPIKNMFKFLKR